MVDGLGNSSNVNQTTNVSRTNSNSGVGRNTTSASENKTTSESALVEASLEKDPTESIFDELKQKGVLKDLGNGKWEFVCDGKTKLSEIRSKLDLGSGVIYANNGEMLDKYCEDNKINTWSSNYLDNIVLDEGTKLTLKTSNFGLAPVTYKDDNGKEMDGFKKDINGKLFYVVQSGDTGESIQKKFNSESLEGFDTKAAMKSILDASGRKPKNGEWLIAAGVKGELPEKPEETKKWWQFWK